MLISIEDAYIIYEFIFIPAQYMEYIMIDTSTVIAVIVYWQIKLYLQVIGALLTY